MLDRDIQGTRFITKPFNGHYVDMDDVTFGLVCQITTILKGIEIQHTMNLIHEYGFDHMYTSFFNTEKETYDTTELGEFRPILDKSYESGDDGCTMDVFCNTITGDILRGKTNTPYGGNAVYAKEPIIYRNNPEENAVIDDNIQKIENSVKDIISDNERLEYVNTKYDYINDRYITSVTDVNEIYNYDRYIASVPDADITYDCICYVGEIDEENSQGTGSEDDKRKVYLYDKDGSKLELVPRNQSRLIRDMIYMLREEHIG